ncbi:TonB-dependent receptor [Janthinobacterium fluminis]|uniref:TonB-dependent receptor n=1 Tax=Janthinobacterium fluminis TaxID=2987524 RepID=A0ABT5K580_9BURK|nr:TonB-dependent receptor [Janthinobacterium fluminis]MDC8760164.1 TonB-dependent receptor [Janthinobacterium fluminis]
MNFNKTVVAAAVAALCAPAFSQSSPSGQPEVRTLPTVTVSASRAGDKLSLDEVNNTGSRLGLTPRETPASVAIVDRATIEARGAANTQEILSSVPGVTAASPPGSAGSVYYRGFGSSSLTQLFNGITPQYDAIAARPVDSWIYERVEVIGGPSTYLFGAGAVGGSINYVTKLAQRDADALEWRARYGSFATADLALGVNRRLGEAGGAQHYARLDVNRGRSNGYVDGQRRDALNVAASLLSDIGPRLSHTLALEYQHEKVDRPYWGTPLLNPATGDGRIDPATRFKNYNSADGVYEQTVQWARSLLEYRLSPNSTLKNTVYHYNALRDFRNVENYAFNADNTKVLRSGALLQRHDQQLNGDRVEWTHKGELGGMKADWSAGLDYSRNTQTRFPLSLSGPVSTVDPYVFQTERFFDVSGMKPGFTPDRTNKVNTLALFLENRLRLTPALALVTGLRHDRIDIELVNHKTASAANPADFKHSYRPTTGRLGLVYDLAPHANVYVQYSTAADPPAGILSSISYGQARGSELTTGRQFEVGSKFDYLGGRGSATLAAYQVSRKNLAIADQNNPGTTLPVGQQSARGVEAATSFKLNPAWLLEGNLAYTDAQYDSFIETVGGKAVSRAGKVPANIPAWVSNLWLSWNVSPALQLSADARHLSRRYGNTANTVSDAGYTLFGASLSYQIQPNTRLTARVKNLTDKVYAANVGSTSFYLGAPRSLDLTLQAWF